MRLSFAVGVVTALFAATVAAQQQRDSTAHRGRQLPTVEVIGAPAALVGIPGSGTLLSAGLLKAINPRDAGQALRVVPGLLVRDEEGLGLRPNIGIRGLNSTRSAKVLLLEDGIPFTIAPYGDNATYYHPPVERFDRIEVLKGSGQIRYGPQTIGGVINYLTPALSREWKGLITTTIGNREYLNLAGRAQGRVGAAAVALHGLRKSGAGSRDNIGSRLTDLSAKVALPLGANQSLTWRADYYAERSQVTYSGLTEAEFAANPRQNPFGNDSMFLDRWATDLTHRLAIGDRISLSTTAYAYLVSRDWWRQSSNSGQRPNDAADPRCGGLANLSTTCGNEGRLRDYHVGAVEPRLKAQYHLGPIPVVAELGIRLHAEQQIRRQVNGGSPNARQPGSPDDPNAGLKEDNLRSNIAFSAYWQQRFQLGRVGVTPGLRFEQVRFRRANRLFGPAQADTATGATSLTTAIPGLGLTWLPSDRLTLFAGVHRGFSPPRTEDIVDNSGQAVDIDTESSWNYELGARAGFGDAGAFEATYFRMDFSNQVVPSSVAGGAGAALTNAGATRHAGVEFALDLNLSQLARTGIPIQIGAAYTYLATARYHGPRFGFVGTTTKDGIGRVFVGQDAVQSRDRVLVTGNRLPYAPKHLASAWGSIQPWGGTRVRADMVLTSAMFADPLNTTVLSPDGQQGPLARSTIWNLGLWQEIPALGVELSVSIKNFFDRLYVVDRSRGLLSGPGRTVALGVSRAF